jgi:hypothetical protein
MVLANGCSYDSGDALAHTWFVLLAHFHPSPFIIYATVIAEQFGYGFDLPPLWCIWFM